MVQFVSGRNERGAPQGVRTIRLLPAVIALAMMWSAPVTAVAQTPPAPTEPPQTAPTTPPATNAPPATDAPKATPAAPDAPGSGTAPTPGNKGKRNRAPAPAGQEATDLVAVMHGLKDNAKLLNGALASEDFKVALNAVVEMERFAALAKKFEPNDLATIPEADKPAHVVAFRKALIGLVKQLLEIETSVLDGKYAPALEMMKGPLLDMRDDAHDTFQAKKPAR
ncbi:MAG TPA: hypothetical protein VK824_07665 [Planctomycetota bacterium]|nr:hypothetical protein [Planctomycetota bacterium]